MQFEVLWIDEENFSETQKAVKYRLEQLKIEQKDILRTRLLLEEIFFSMIENGEVQQVKVQVVKNFFGKVQIKMTAEGFSYNPIVEVTDWNEDDEDEDYFRMMILKANRQRLNWSRNQNFNVVTIDVRSESNKQLWILAACIVEGIVCGIVMKEFLSPEAIAFITENFITPIQTMFLNALNMIVTPLIFFSIISGITDMGAGAS